MASLIGTDSTMRTTINKQYSKQEQAEWLEKQLKHIQENYDTYKNFIGGNYQRKSFPQFKTKGRNSLEELNINWEIIDKKLYIALIFKTNDLKKYEILETLRSNGCFKQTLGKDLPQLVQTLDNYIALCYSTNDDIIPYWNKEKLRNQFTQQYTQTTREKVYSVVKKKEFEKKIDNMLPKTFDINELKGKNYLYIPLLVKNNTKDISFDTINHSRLK